MGIRRSRGAAVLVTVIAVVAALAPVVAVPAAAAEHAATTRASRSHRAHARTAHRHRSADLVGTVRSPGGRHRVAGATVVVRDLATHRAVRCRTDSTGVFRTWRPPGRYRLRALPPTGHRGRWLPATAATTIRGTAARPRRSAVPMVMASPDLGGSVTMPDGSPAADARVRVEDVATGAPVQTVQSAADGSWATDVPAGNYRVVADPAAGTSVATALHSTPQEVFLLDGESALQVALTLELPTVTGVVRDPGGAPVHDAVLLANRDGYQGGYVDVPWAVDPDGSFGVALRPGRTYHLVAKLPPGDPRLLGPGTLLVDVPFDSVVTGLDLRLTPFDPPAYRITPVPGPGGYTADSPEPIGLSADGTRVLYLTTIHDAGTASRQLFVHDRTDGTTTLVSASADGTPADADILGGSISADGTAVAYYSHTAGNLVPGTRGGIFQRVLADPESTLVDGFVGDTTPSISRDGSLVAYPRQVSPGTGGAVGQVVVWHAADGTVQVVDEQAGTQFDKPILSADGATVAYLRHSTQRDWVVRALTLPELHVVVPDQPLVDPGAEAPWFGFDAPTLSADGRRLVWRSEGADFQGRLHLWDRTDPREQPLEPLPPERLTSFGQGPASLSLDGRTLVTATTVNDDGAVSADTNEPLMQLWSYDLSSGALTAVARDANGAPADGGVRRFAVGDDASTIAFTSPSTNLPGGPGSGYVAVLGPATAPTWPPGATLGVSPAATSAHLTWPAAEDDEAVAGYRIMVDGSQVAEVAADRRAFDVTGLAPSTSYTFSVAAYDGTGLVSSGNPTTAATTLAAGGTTGRLGADVTDGGTVTLSWDPADGVSEFVVTGHGPDDALRTVTVTGTSTTLTGLAAGSAWTFGVATSDGLGHTTEYAGPASVTIPALSLDSVTRTISLRSGYAPRGSRLTISAHGEAGRLASAVVSFTTWYADDGVTLLDSPRAVTALLGLTEARPGVYSGVFDVASGVAGIDGVTATVSDGQGHATDPVAATPSTPITVAGDLQATVAAPAGSLPGRSLVISSDTGHYRSALGVDGGASMSATDLAPGYDYAVTLLDPDGTVNARRQAVQVRPGLVTDVSIVATVPARLSVRVTDPDGRPVPGADVAVNTEAGQFLGAVRTGSDGRALVPREARPGSTVTAEITGLPDDTLEATGASRTTVAAGPNELALGVRRYERTTVSGTVRFDDDEGSPSIGGTVTLEQVVNGELWSVTTNTRDDGTYRLDALAKPATVSVRGAEGGPVELALAHGPATGVDFVIVTGRPRRLHLRLLRPDGSAQPLDWRTAAHFHLSGSIGALPLNYWGGQPEPDGALTVQVWARGGDPVHVCADGAEGGYGAACTDTVIRGDEQDVAIRLPDAPTFTGTAEDPAGSSLPAGRFALTLQRIAGGEVVWSRTTTPSAAFAETGDGPGEYRLVLDQWTPTSHLRAERRRPGVRTAGVALGELPLSDAPGVFSGAANRTTAGQPEVSVGGTVSFRAGFASASGTTVEGLTASISVPAHTTLLPQSITVDGRPAGGTARPGFVDVPIGDLPAGGTGVVTYALRVEDGFTSPSLPGEVVLEHDALEESLGVAPVAVVGVTLEAPPTTSTRSIVVSGRAPVGARVELTEGDATLAVAESGPSGLWRADVDLPDRGPAADYLLVAAATHDGTSVTSTPRAVRYDASTTEPVRACLSQQDRENAGGRQICWDPRRGVGQFPFVFVPGQATSVEVEYNHPEKVHSSSAEIGRMQATTVTTQQGSVTSLTGMASGPIWLGYDASPMPASPPAPPASEATLRSLLPPPMTGYQVTSTTTGGAGSGVADIEISTPGVLTAAGRPGGIGMHMSMQRSTYSPTEADLAAQADSGVPVWDSSLSATAGGFTMSGKIPVSDLGGSPAGGHAARAPAVSAPSAGGATVVAEFVFNVTTNTDAGWSALDGGGKYQALTDLLGDVGGCMTPAQISGFTFDLQQIARQALRYDVLNSAISVAGLWVAPETFGIGTVALWAVGWLIGKATDRAIEKATDKIRKRIAAVNANCDQTTRKRTRLGDPTWIYDPSGYAYEGARSRRVEGATATLLTGPTDHGPWQPADMTAYGQTNPVTTDSDGQYGWDVPEGWWTVELTRDGYLPAQSDAVRVLPPHTDVDVSMVATGRPRVAAVTARPGPALRVEFDRPVRPASVADGIGLGFGGGDVAVAVTPVDPGPGVDGGDLATTYDVTGHDADLGPGTYTLRVASTVVDYAGRPTGEDVTRQVVLPGSAAATTLQVDCGEEPATIGLPTTCGATVGGPGDRSFTGRVTVTSDGADVTPCTLVARPSGATCSFRLVPRPGSAGHLSLAAGYADDPAHADQSAAAEIAVGTRAAGVTTSCTPRAPAAGGEARCQVTVSDLDAGRPLPPDGSVDVAGVRGTASSPTCTLLALDEATAACSVTVTAEGTGRVELEATWPGDRDHTPTALVMVLPHRPFASSRRVAVGYRPVVPDPAATFDVRYRRAGRTGGWTRYVQPEDWRSTTAQRQVLVGRPGSTYCFSARLHGGAGRVSAWSAERCTTVPLDDRRLRASGSWVRRDAGAYEHTSSATRQHGASLVLRRVAGSGVAVVATRCPGCGRVTLRWGGLTEKVSLRSRTVRRDWTFLWDTGPRRGRLSIEVASHHRLVVVDAVGVRR